MHGIQAESRGPQRCGHLDGNESLPWSEQRKEDAVAFWPKASWRTNAARQCAHTKAPARNKHKVPMHGPLRLVSYVIVASMAGAVLYAFYISVTYWTGIGV